MERVVSNPFEQALEEIERELKIREARQNYLKYVMYTNPGYKETKFHTYLCGEIDTFLSKKPSNTFDILLLSVPPQFGKSTTITEALPSYYMGRNPEKRVILVSYNEEFAQKFGRANLRKIKEYHGDIFPECVLMESPCNNTEFETTKGGRCISRGITSGIAGNPADLIIIDDPIKNRGEAESLVTRNNIYGEWLSSVRTRIAPGGKVVVIQTRWHEDDLYGKLSREEKNITVINLPCECENPESDPIGRQKGDALCPEIGRGNDWLQEFKEVYRGKEGTRAWTSLYQGHPTSLEGNILKREWWRYYTNTDVDINKLPYKILSVDAAFKDGDDNDFVAIQLWGKINDNYYLIDYIEKHLDFIGTLEAIRDMHARHKDIWYTLIEDKANGSAIINVLSKEFEGIVPIKPEGGKVARANAVSFAIEAGRVWLPKLGAFVESFVEECSTFPNGIHDDAVDAMTQALNRMIHVDATVVNPKTIKYTEWTEDMFVDYENASDALKLELLDLWGHPQEWRE